MRIIDSIFKRATIKGILALLIVGTGFPALLYMATQGNETAVEVVKIVVTAVIFTYFGSEMSKEKGGM